MTLLFWLLRKSELAVPRLPASRLACLQTIGFGQYEAPQISSNVIRFDGAAFPTKQNPGGPTQVYHFTAMAEGEAQVRIPHTNSNRTVAFMIQVNADGP